MSDYIPSDLLDKHKISWQDAFSMGIVQNQGGRVNGKKVWLNINARNFHKVRPGQTAIILLGMYGQLQVKIISVGSSRSGVVKVQAADGRVYSEHGWNISMIKVG